jgi:hypothetical protein
MAEKPQKKAAKPRKADKSVLGSLPATRPERIGRYRPSDGANATKAAKPRATTSGREPAVPAAARPSAGGPRPVSAGAPGIAPGDGRDALADREARHTGTEVAVGMIRAAGELTRLSISAWAEFVRRAMGRR